MKELTLLIIEDNEADAFLIEHFLKSSSYHIYHVNHERTLKSACNWLQNHSPDLIALDLGLPDAVDLTGVELLITKHADIPLIVATGNRDSELARQAIMMGAQDYLIKGELNSTLLDKTFTFAIERHRLKQTLEEKEIAFQKAQGQLDLLTENSSDLIVIIDMNLNIRFTSSNHPQFFQLRESQNLGTDPYEFVYSADIPELKNLMDQFIDRSITEAQPIFRIVNQTTKQPEWVEAKLSIKKHTAFGEEVILADVRNINKRKKAELENQKLLQAINQSANSIVITDTNGNITYVNLTFELTTGYTYAEAIGNNPRILASGYHDDAYYSKMWSLISQGHTWQGELVNKKKDGEIYWERATIDPVLDEDGEIISYIAVKEDITERKEKEMQLLESKQRLQLALEGTNAGLWDWNIQTGQTIHNERWAEIIGYTLEELNPVTIDAWNAHTHPDDLELSNQKLQEHWDGKADFYDCRVRMIHKDGHIVWVWDRGKVVEWDQEGKPLRMLGTHIDVSELVESENKIKEATNQLDLALEATKAGLWQLDLTNNTAQIDDRWAMILGYTIEELAPISLATWTNLLHPSDKAGAIEYLESFISGEIDQYENRFRMRHKSGHYVDILAKGKKVQFDDRKEKYVIGTNQDISLIASMEDSLKQSEELYRTVVESLSEGLLIYDDQGDIIFANESAHQILKIPQEKLVGGHMLDPHWEISDPDGWPIDPKAYPAVITSGTGQAVDGFLMRIKRGDSTSILSINSRAILNDDGKVSSTVLSLNDITKSYLYQKQLIESEQKLEFAFQSANVGYWEWDVMTNEGTMNEVYAKNLGYTLEELTPITLQTFQNLCHPDDLQASDASFADLFAGRTTSYQQNLRMKHKAGVWKWFMGSAQIMTRDENGHPKKIIGIDVNIDPLIRQNEAIKSSEEQYRFLAESVPHVLWSADADGNITYVNNNGLRILGADLEKLKHNNWLEILHPHDTPSVIEKWTRSITSKKIYNNIQRFKTKNGKYKWFQVTANPMLIDGKVHQWIGMSTDIHEQEVYKREIEKKQSDLQRGFSIAHIDRWEYNIDRDLFTWSDGARSITKIPLHVPLDTWTSLQQFFHPDDRLRVVQSFEQAWSTGFFKVEHRYQQSDGSINWVRVIADIEKDPGTGELIATGVIQDISEEKDLMSSVITNEQRFRRIFESISEGFLLLDMEGTILDINPAGKSILGIMDHSDIQRPISEWLLDQNSLEEVYKLLQINGSVHKWILEIKKMNGSECIVRINANLVNLDDQHELVEISFAEITEEYELNTVSAAINMLNEMYDESSYNEIIQAGVDAFQKLSNSKIAFFHLVNADQETIHLVQWSTSTKKICEVPGRAEHYPISSAGIWVECVKTKEAVFHNDYQRLEHKGGLPQGHVHLIRDLEVPILENNEVVAIIGVGNKPYNYSALDVTLLKTFSVSFWNIIQRKKEQEELERNRTLLEEAQQVGNIGTWYLDIKNEPYDLWWSEGMKQIHGLNLNKSITYDSYLERLTIDDQQNIEQLFKKSIRTGEIEYTHQIDRFDQKGRVIIKTKCKGVRNKDGKIVMFLGISQDVTEQVKLLEDLANSKEQLNLAIEGANLAIIDRNLINGHVEVNDKYLELIGLTAEEGPFTHRKVLKDIIHPDDKSKVATYYEEIESGRRSNFNFTARTIKSNGEIIHIESIGKVVFDKSGKPVRSVGVLMDITKRRLLEQSLMETNRQMSSLIDSIPGVVFRCSIDKGRYEPTFLSNYLDQITGYKLEDFLPYGKLSLRDLVVAEDLEQVETTLKNAFQSKAKYQTTYRIKTKDDQTKWIAESGAFERYDTVFFASNLEGVMMDITDRVINEERKLSLTVEVEDRERRRIAQEIHDGVQQTLITALLNLETVKKEIDKLTAKTKERYCIGYDYLQQGINDTRGIAHRLMPKAISDFGYIRAVRNLIDNLSEGFTVDIYDNLKEERLPAKVELSLFRITQEALNNIIKYASAKNVLIQIIKSGTHLNLSIEDDGVGFDLNTLNYASTGIGISSMKNRAGAIGGIMEINSAPGKGTFIMIDVKLNETNQ